MTTIEIPVNVSLPAALAQSRSAYGKTTVALDDAAVARLSPAAKALLSESYNESVLVEGGRLDVAVADIEHVVAALEARGARSAAQRAQEAVDREAQIRKALAAPVDEWLMFDGRVCEGGLWLDTAGRGDPRIVAHRAKIDANEGAALRAQIAAESAARQKAHDDAEAERNRQIDAYDAAVVRVASDMPALARAAKEGYPVETQVIVGLVGQLSRRVHEQHVSSRAIGTVQHATDWTESTDLRAAPSPESFALADAVAAAVAAENAQLPAELGRWRAGKVVRLDTCSERNRTHNVTVVQAVLDAPHRKARETVTFSLEPLTCDCGCADEE